MNTQKIKKAVIIIENKLKKTALTKQDFTEIDNTLEHIISQIEVTKKYFKRLSK